MDLTSTRHHDRIVGSSEILESPLAVGPVALILLCNLRFRGRRKAIHHRRGFTRCCRHNTSRYEKDNKRLPELHRHLTLLFLLVGRPQSPLCLECTA